MDPLASTQSVSTPPVSAIDTTISGLAVTVHGLAELPPAPSGVVVVWLIHARLCDRRTVAPLARMIVGEWNARRGTAGSRTSASPPTGLITVALDQRNHGDRTIDPIANNAWRPPTQGTPPNPRHAADMFGTIQGTADDIASLLPHVPATLFPGGGRRVRSHAVVGASLGAHAAWALFSRDRRVDAAVSLLGCPDFSTMIGDRARLSRLPEYHGRGNDNGKAIGDGGSALFGSPAFPPALVDAVAAMDPAQSMFRHLPALHASPAVRLRLQLEHELAVREGRVSAPTVTIPAPEFSSSSSSASPLPGLLRAAYAGKHLLSIAAANDKAVPPGRGQPFVDWLAAAMRPGGWATANSGNEKSATLDITTELVSGVGHEVTPQMAVRAVAWLCDVLGAKGDGPLRSLL